MHRLITGRLEAIRGRRSKPTAKLVTRQGSVLPDGQKPTQAIATSTPSVAAAAGIFESSYSDDTPHAASRWFGRPAVIPSGGTLDDFSMHVRRDLFFRKRERINTYVINGAGELEAFEITPAADVDR